MAELESIISAVRSGLESGVGVASVDEFPAGMKKSHEAPVMTVGIKKGEGRAAGFAEYIGEKYYPDTDTYREIYGKRMEITLAINIYSPERDAEGSMGCLDMAGKVIAAMQDMPPGIKIRKVSCGAVSFDDKTGMFLCPVSIDCVCFMYAEKQEEKEILDFTLRGVLSK